MKRFACLFIFLIMPIFAFAQATHDELKIALGNQALKDKVEVSILIVVDKIIKDEDTDAGFDPENHDNRVIWARRIMSDPGSSPKEAARFFPIIIVSNRQANIDVILNASDAVIQTNVERIVDLFADGT